MLQENQKRQNMSPHRLKPESSSSKNITMGTVIFSFRVVPRTYTRGRSNSLGHWVKYMRNAYRGLLAHPTRLGQESPGSVMAPNKLSKLRIERLEAMGFEWSLALRSVWEEHLQDLVEFNLSTLINVMPMLFLVSCVRFCLRKKHGERKIEEAEVTSTGSQDKVMTEGSNPLSSDKIANLRTDMTRIEAM
jgi:hypothetical protein